MDVCVGLTGYLLRGGQPPLVEGHYGLQLWMDGDYDYNYYRATKTDVRMGSRTTSWRELSLCKNNEVDNLK